MRNWRKRIVFIAIGLLMALIAFFYPIKSQPKYKEIVFRSITTYVMRDGKMIQIACNDTAKVELKYNEDTLIFKQWNRSIGFKPLGITSKTLIVQDDSLRSHQINIGNYMPEGGQFAYFFYGDGVVFLYTLPKCFKL